MKAKNPARRIGGKRGVDGKPPVVKHGKTTPTPAPLQGKLDLWPLAAHDLQSISRQRKNARHELEQALNLYRCSADLFRAAHACLLAKLKENPSCRISAGDTLCHVRYCRPEFVFSNDLKTLVGLIWKAAGFAARVTQSKWAKLLGQHWLKTEAAALPPALLALAQRQRRAGV